MRFTFGGDAAVTYPTYLDAEGGTLVAEPGHTYEIRPAEGYTVPGEDGQLVPLKLPVPPDDRWSKAEAKPEPKKKEN